MTRLFDKDLLQRISEERHRLIRTGSFGPNYNVVVDAYRTAQEADKDSPRRVDSDSVLDSKRDYKELE